MKSSTGIAGAVVACLVAALGVWLNSSAGAQSQFAGQWIIELDSFKSVAGQVHISLRYDNEGGGHSETSHMIAREQLQGLSETQAMSPGSAVQFQIRRDAGAFNCEGWFREGKGSGHFVFAGSQSYVSELRRRGYEAPTGEQLFRLGLGDVSLALIEELRKQGYERSDIDQLVRVGTHGVTIDYIREIGALGYRVGQVDKLVRMRDHSVTPEFVKGIKQAGFDKISAEELVRCRDHGVTPEYIRKLRSRGVQNLTLDQIIRLRDHGID